MTGDPCHLEHPHRLRRIKARMPVSSCKSMMEPLVATGTVNGVERILQVFLGDPWNDYVFVRHIGQNIIARKKNSYFKLVNIRQCHREKILIWSLDESKDLSNISIAKTT